MFTIPLMTAVPLNGVGWVFMVVALTFVTGLVLWCYGRVLTLPTDPAEETEE